MDLLGGRFRWRRLPALVEVVTIGLGYGLYSLVRLIAPSTAAYAHAGRVISVERATGLFHELELNDLLVPHHWLVEFASYWYATAHFIVTPVVLAWLWHGRAWAYSLLRSSLVISTVSALVIYASWPLAPPRLVLSGAIDTVTQNPVVWAKQGAPEFVNEYAAMPSLHVGWSIWCAIAIVAVLKTRWRHLAWLYPITTTWVVVATANHYFLDAIAGGLFIVVPLYVCGLRPAHLWQGSLVRPHHERELAVAS